jgi:hypothetical protein
MRLKLAIPLAVFAASSLLAPRSVVGASASDPCSLLTPAQVGAVLGGSVGAGQPIGTNACAWRESGGPVGKKAWVTHVAVDIFELSKSAGLETIAPVTGIGDDAYYSSQKGVPPTLRFKKGSNAFTVQVISSKSTPDEVKAMEKALALDMLAKL